MCRATRQEIFVSYGEVEYRGGRAAVSNLLIRPWPPAVDALQTAPQPPLAEHHLNLRSSMRRQLVALLVPIAIGASAPVPFGAAAPAMSRSLAPRGVKSANLQEQLEKGLRARLPREFAFINRVVTMVEKGQLPLDLVRGTFDWARKKRPYPFPYFEQGLKKRAARIGIKVR